MVRLSNQAMSLFNYLDNQHASEQALQQVASNQKQATFQELTVANGSIAQGNFDELLNDIENGTSNIDLNTMANYVNFNMNKLNDEITQLANRYQVSLPVEIALKNDSLEDNSLKDNALQVLDNSDAGQALQSYLDKDQRLQHLVNQTSKLSEFYEWGSVREQGLNYQNANIDDDSLLEYLQEGRNQIIHQNSLTIHSHGAQFSSENQAEQLIAKYNEKFGYTENNPSQTPPSNLTSSAGNATTGVSVTA